MALNDEKPVRDSLPKNLNFVIIELKRCTLGCQDHFLMKTYSDQFFFPKAINQPCEPCIAQMK